MQSSSRGGFTAESVLPCPECGSNIHVGTAGNKNLDIHRDSKACKSEHNRRNACAWPKRKPQPNQTLHAFFGVKPAPNPSQVYAPPPVHASEARVVVSMAGNDVEDGHTFGLASGDGNSDGGHVLGDAQGDAVPVSSPGNNSGGCPLAINLLSKLRKGIERIPPTNAIATTEHRLQGFGGDPTKYVNPEVEDSDTDWEELLNPMMKQAFGWGDHETKESAKVMLHRGQYGLDGFVNFLGYFVAQRGLMGGLIESKVMAILEALEFACVTFNDFEVTVKLTRLTQISTHNYT
jgi:hypothetical protein